VQTLGYAERLLLDMEARLAALARDVKGKKERDRLLSECSAHSVLWVFGLYEILRTVRESGAPQFAVLEPVFRKLEVLRMPLAKHEAKNTKGTTPPPHYPTGCWDVDTGQVGWQVFNPRTGSMEVLSRTPLANEFLLVAAGRPNICRLFRSAVRWASLMTDIAGNVPERSNGRQCVGKRGR
jgi:hypothetical protein